MENNMIEIFIGSDIDANYISSLLVENDIDCKIENTLTQSISAGWVNGSQYNSTSICVNINDAKKARQIINEYLDNTNE